MLNISINDVLEQLKVKIENDSDYLNATKGTDFENIIGDLLHVISENGTHYTYYHNGEHSFPDFSIIINNERYGLEVKYSNSGTWSTNGNSVFETVSNKGDGDSAESYQEIYIIYGRKPKQREDIEQLEVRYDKYENAVSDITVTHSPRYKLHMRNEENESVFSLIGLPYKEFRLLSVEEKNQLIREYFHQKESQQDKWYMPLSLEDDGENIKPQFFEDLDCRQKEMLLAEVIILYMEDLFANSRANYKRVVNYLVSEYFVVSASMRDKFSASGKATIDTLNSELEYPQMLNTYQDKLPFIEIILDDPEPDFESLCYSTWEESELLTGEIDNNLSFKENYLNVIDSFNFSVKTKDLNANQGETEPRPYLSILFRDFIKN